MPELLERRLAGFGCQMSADGGHLLRLRPRILGLKEGVNRWLPT